MFMSYLKRTYTVQSCSSSVRTLHDENVPAASRSNVQIFKPGMRANRFMAISLFLVYTLLYIEWDFSLVTFYFSGNSPSWSFPSPCSLFTATEVIRTVTSKNARCCGYIFFVLESGKPVRASPLYLVFLLFLIIEELRFVKLLSMQEH